MKIISKFKDYYDFLQGIYGIDEKIIYERHCEHKHTGSDRWEKGGVYKPLHISLKERHDGPDFLPIAVCGIIHCVYYYKGKFYFGKEVEQLSPLVKALFGARSSFDIPREAVYVNKYHLTSTKLNEQENCPVLLTDHYGDELHAIIKNPKLADFGFASYIDPKVLYLQVSNFLSREKPIVDKRTNVEKIISHGFDKKTSFRNIK